MASRPRAISGCSPAASCTSVCVRSGWKGNERNERLVLAMPFCWTCLVPGAQKSARVTESAEASERHDGYDDNDDDEHLERDRERKASTREEEREDLL